MSASAMNTNNEVQTKHFENVLNSFDVRKYTDAKLQMKGSFHFSCSPETLFEYVSNPERIAEWFGMIKGGNFNHDNSSNDGALGEGSLRVCNTSMGTLNETIYFIEQPYIVAYNVQSWSMPVKDHCAVMIIEPQDDGSCILVWLQYFNYKGFIMRRMFPAMMLKMMNDGMQKLREKLGGNGGKMEAA